MGILWLYKYYGNVQIVEEAYNYTKVCQYCGAAAKHAAQAFVEFLSTEPTNPMIFDGLGDWMSIEPKSIKMTGTGQSCALAVRLMYVHRLLAQQLSGVCQHVFHPRLQRHGRRVHRTRRSRCRCDECQLPGLADRHDDSCTSRLRLTAVRQGCTTTAVRR